jgi:hypothetical protein
MIPGFIIALLTFPGVIVHELAHQFFCRLLKVPVFKVCYIRVGNPSGYVIHEHPHSPWKSLLIGYGPLLVNSILGTLIAFPAVLSLIYLNNGWWLDGLLLYLGFSIAMHSFPSTGDAASIWKAIMGPSSSIFAKIVGVPLVGIIWAGAVGSVFWLDAIYGGCLVGFAPGLIAKLLAAI